jgi:hypothetical protein
MKDCESGVGTGTAGGEGRSVLFCAASQSQEIQGACSEATATRSPWLGDTQVCENGAAMLNHIQHRSVHTAPARNGVLYDRDIVLPTKKVVVLLPLPYTTLVFP